MVARLCAPLHDVAGGDEPVALITHERYFEHGGGSGPGSVPVGIEEPVERVGGGFKERVASGDVAESAAGGMEVDAGGAGHRSQDNALAARGSSQCFSDCAWPTSHPIYV